MSGAQHATLLAGPGAGCAYGVGAAAKQRLARERICRGVIFEIGVLNEREISAGLLHRRAHGGSFPLVDAVPVESDDGMPGGQLLEDGVSAVSGAIIYNDQLAIHVLRNGGGEHERNTLF